MAKKKILMTDLDMNKNEVKNARIENVASDPASGAAGQVVYNTADGKMKVHNGTSFAPVGGTVAEYKNTAVTPASGVASWEITNPAGSTKVDVKVFEVSSGDEVGMCVNVTASTIKLEWNCSDASVAAETYRAVVLY